MLEQVIKGFQVQGRVIQAILLRELRTRFGHYYLGYLWAVIVPLLYIILLTSVYAAIGRRTAHGVPIEVMLLSGMMVLLTFLDVQNQASRAFQNNQQLLPYPMVSVMDIVIARTLLEFGTKVCVIIILILIYSVCGVSAGIDEPLGVIVGVVVMAYLAMMYGHIVGCIILIVPSMQFLFGSMRRLLFFTSGAMYLLSDLPPEWRRFVLLNPIAHVIDMVRGAWIAGYSGPYGQPSYVAKWALALTTAAAIAELTTRRWRLRAKK